MRLKYQLFITLLIASVLLVAVMIQVSSLSFSRGFLGYINKSDNERIYVLSEELGAQYARDGNWDNTVSDPKVLRSLLRSSGMEDWRRRIRKPNRAHRDNPPPPIDRIQRRLILANADKQLLLGRINNSSTPQWQPINHNGELVGYIGVNRLRQLDNQIDLAFERQQKKSFAIAGLTMALLSALLSAPLAARIVNPILKVKNTVAEISNGNFADRVNTSRRDEIGDLSRDINKLGETLEKNRDTRRKNFAEISHELRTPVAMLQAELEALQDGIRTIDRDAVDSLHAETLKLNRLIDDLHALSLADAGALEYQMQTVNFNDLLHSQIEKYKEANPDLDITFTSSCATININGDPQRLAQLTDNLMQNTARYTNKPGRLQIRLTTEKNQTTLSWEDTTPGVSTEALGSLFDPLYRAESSRSREHGGSGLGLSIVKKIAEAHGGTCTADHSGLGGLAVSIKFPNSGHR